MQKVEIIVIHQIGDVQDFLWLSWYRATMCSSVWCERIGICALSSLNTQSTNTQQYNEALAVEGSERDETYQEETR